MIASYTKLRAPDLTSDFLTEKYLHGIRLEDLNGVPYPPKALEFHIQRSLGAAEEILGISLKKTIVKAEPVDDGLVKDTDYHKKIKRLPYYRLEATKYYKLNLPDAQVKSIERLRGFHLNQAVLTFDIKDVRLEHINEGILHVIPRLLTGFLVTLNFGSVYPLSRSIIGYDFLPDFWAVDYTCGFDEYLPDRVVEWVLLNAAIQVLGIVGTALTPGLSSQSVSFDSYTHAETLTQSPSTHLYSALERMYKDERDRIDLQKIRGTYRGLKVFSL